MADQTNVLQQIQALFVGKPVGIATILTAMALLAGYTATQTNNLGGDLTGNMPSPIIGQGVITADKLAANVIPQSVLVNAPAGGSLQGNYPAPVIKPGAISSSMLANGATNLPGQVGTATGTLSLGSRYTCALPGATMTLPNNAPIDEEQTIADCTLGITSANPITVQPSADSPLIADHLTGGNYVYLISGQSQVWKRTSLGWTKR